MFTPEYSLLRRSIPFGPPCPPSHPSSRPARPATRPGPPPDPARHGVTRPDPPPHLASHPSLQACLPRQPCPPLEWPSSAATASRSLLRDSAVLCLLQRLCVSGASQRATPSSPIFYVPPPNIYVLHLKFYVPLQKSTYSI